ncbi:TPA: restriction endonuclease subunit S [Pasteurella multocida]|uniref:Protein HsdA n=1 Tax=Pasteurella canis TaxID=753 RepID=A0A379EWG1_9PAST|nr:MULTISPECIES: restriction endonuclease subunit S [Pasteurella]AWB52834.1 protein HsdA [Pasteurella multocida]MEB3480852.1 restriction endonuclease subunit S [Pasteurella multocida]SUC10727.1 protein HsdA [Pasteurella canis]HDR1152665.1 restriction endonuclease subunit S [Pasteurella multocida]HDR1159205.1 restriction endonuclease subunit S [Pasteurella multocida]
MSSWKEYKLEEVLDALIDYRGKTPTKTGFGIPLITAKVVKNGRLEQATEFIAVEDYESWMSRGLPKIGDIVLTTEAPLGEVAQLKDEKVALAQRIVTLRGKDKILQNDFLLYLLQSKNIQEQLEARSSGSTVKGIKQSELRKLTLKIPSFSEQEFISGQLKALDNKIQLNTQINQTLEQIAQAIFKSWFVDFDPVKAKIDILTNGGTHADAERAAMQVISGKTDAELSQMQQTNLEAYKTLEKTAALFPSEMVESELGEVPKGWGIGCIGDIATAKGGYAFKSSQFEQKGNPVIKIKNITSTGNIILEDCQCINDLVANVASKFKLSDGDFLMAMTGATVGKIGIYVSDGRCAFVNQRVAKFESKLFKNIPCWYTYNLIRRSDVSEKIIGSAQGSAQANISSSGIEQVAIMLPIRDLIYLYQSTVSHLYKKWIANHKELLKLKMTRDTLLPKLLSGELNS